MFKLIIFDYDGLLVDSERLAYIAEEKILIRYGKTLSKGLFNKYLGYSVADTLKGYIDNYKIPVSLDKLYKERKEILRNLLKSHLKLMPGAKILLNFLKNKKIDMVIASSSKRKHIELGLKKLKASHYFRNITCVSEVKKGKPHPDLFLKALKKNNAKPGEAIVFEDSIAGIKAAKSAGIFCITIPPRNIDISEYSLVADLVLDNLAKAKEILEK